MIEFDYIEIKRNYRNSSRNMMQVNFLYHKIKKINKFEYVTYRENMYYGVNKNKEFYCKIAGIGHSEINDSKKFEVVSQFDFINSLSEEIISEITKKGEKTISQVASIWSDMISEYRQFFSGSVWELATFAIKRCFKSSSDRGFNIDASEIDAVIGATNTGPYYPSLADYVKNDLDARSKAMCFDVTEACTAGSVGLFQAYSMISSGACKNVLVVSSEKASALTKKDNWQGSNLFGDASFACLLTRSKNPEDESFTLFNFSSDPYDNNLDLIQKKESGFTQNGRKVHLFVIRDVVEEMEASIQKSNIDINDIKHLITHQPSKKTVSSLIDGFLSKFPGYKGKIHRSENIGNASSASFGHLLSTSYHNKLIKDNENILTCTFGAGLSIGIVLLKL